MSGARRYPAWVDGRLHAPGEGRVASDDAGLLLGLAVFETLLHEDGCTYFVEEHLARLERGLAAVRIATPLPWDPRAALAEYAAALGGETAALRLTVTRGVPGGRPSVVVGAREVVHPPRDGARVAVASHAKDARDALESVKTTDRVRNVLLRESAQARGFFEVLLCTREGDVSEATVSNVFAVVGGELVTPSLDRGCLAGTVRGAILAEMRGSDWRPVERRLELSDLERASEVFLSNTTGRVIPVREVEGVAKNLPAGRGPTAAEAARRIRALEERYCAARRA